MSNLRRPAVVVLSTLFPSAAQPQAGLFIRERMFRVAEHLPLTVVSPVPWFPLQGLLRRWKPNFRPPSPAYETDAGVSIERPRFFSVPGTIKRLDGLFMALGALPTLARLKRAGRLDVLDAHFGYPDGCAAGLLGRWLGVPVTITLRGTEARHAASPALRKRLASGLRRATRVFAVSASLKRIAMSLGLKEERVLVIGNGVDLRTFHPIAKEQARTRLGIPQDVPVLISVGGLVERKGFHRVIECLPALAKQFPDLLYLIVGGSSPEGDLGSRLRAQVEALGLEQRVRFLGAMHPEDLKVPLSAADVFVLATANEGWANVFLEAMACGLPVVTTDVGGNAEVVGRSDVGRIVPFGDPTALREALGSALTSSWNREAIRVYASTHAWDGRIALLVSEFERIAGSGSHEAGLAGLTPREHQP